MNLYIKNHNFHYELENVIRLFFPNEKIRVVGESDKIEIPYVYSEIGENIRVELCTKNYKSSKTAPRFDGDEENKIEISGLLYKILCDCTGIEQPWGMLTGVRPIKLLRKLIGKYGAGKAKNILLQNYFVSEEKLELAVMTEKYEKKILNLSRPESFSLYVGIPFCPSRCSYCSFVMSSVERTKNLIEPYVSLLCEEIAATAQAAASLGLRLETVYFGGGTPTSLNAEQLRRVLEAVSRNFDLSKCREFTVEAGRPDTIDSERLFALKENNVGRISINPQTTNDNVLREIGRKHTSEQFFEAFSLARKCGFDNINTDLIAGLPTDNFESFKASLDSIRSLSPECITVHTLCMKRASSLSANGVVLDGDCSREAKNMLKYSRKALIYDDYIPYYLYRQSRMAGNLENVGWSKKGYESLYNVFVMDETHTILGCGSGAVTKLKRSDSENGCLKRIFNFKYPYEYIGRFDELMKRKEQIISFYNR